MAKLFADLPEALQNSVEIAKRCNLTLKLGKPHLPDFPTPNGETLDDFLRSESQRGLQQRMLQLYPGRGAARGQDAGISGAPGIRDQHHHQHEVSPVTS